MPTIFGSLSQIKPQIFSIRLLDRYIFNFVQSFVCLKFCVSNQHLFKAKKIIAAVITIIMIIRRNLYFLVCQSRQEEQGQAWSRNKRRSSPSLQDFSSFTSGFLLLHFRISPQLAQCAVLADQPPNSTISRQHTSAKIVATQLAQSANNESVNWALHNELFCSL